LVIILPNGRVVCIEQVNDLFCHKSLNAWDALDDLIGKQRLQSKRKEWFMKMVNLFAIACIVTAAGVGNFDALGMAAEGQPLIAASSKVDPVLNRLAEGLAAKDWKVIEFSAKELKALNLNPVELEAVCVRAERDAAFNIFACGWLSRSTTYSRADSHAQIYVGGLAVRALLGDDKSMTKLRNLAEFKPVLTEKKGVPIMDSKEYWKVISDDSMVDNALLFLTLLKEPNIEARVIKALLEKKETMNWAVKTDTLITAILVNAPQAGLRKLSALYEAPIKREHIFPLLRTLYSLCLYINTDWVTIYKPGEPNQLEFAISKRLSVDFASQLVKPYIALMNHYPSQIKHQDHMFGETDILIGIFHLMPCNDDLLAAAEAFKTKISKDQFFEHFVKDLDCYLKQKRDEGNDSSKNVPVEKTN
jgi:hypothetical protein